MLPPRPSLILDVPELTRWTRQGDGDQQTPSCGVCHTAGQPAPEQRAGRGDTCVALSWWTSSPLLPSPGKRARTGGCWWPGLLTRLTTGCGDPSALVAESTGPDFASLARWTRIGKNTGPRRAGGRPRPPGPKVHPAALNWASWPLGQGRAHTWPWVEVTGRTLGGTGWAPAPA